MLENVRANYLARGRDCGVQGFWVMLVYRLGRWRCGIQPALLLEPFSLLYKLIQMSTGFEFPCGTVVGRNFVVDHFGGIIVSRYMRFDDNCRIRNGVVVGFCRGSKLSVPAIVKPHRPEALRGAAL